MAFEVFDDVAFYYLCTSLLAVFVLPFTCVKVWGWTMPIKTKKLDMASPDSYGSKGTKLKLKRTWMQTHLTVSNVLFVVGWVLFAYMCYKIPSYEGEALLDFQPYAILDLEEGADDNAIKKAYRKMSLKYHPDKNPDNVEAEQKFIQISKAYRALTDPTTKENFQKYGNADGYQGTSVTIGLPSFLTQKDNELKILLVYFLIMIMVPPVIVFTWWQKAKDVHETGALTDTVKIYFTFITDNMSARTLIEVLAASKEYKALDDLQKTNPEVVAKEWKKLHTIVKQDMKESKKFQAVNYIKKANILLHAYLMRVPVHECLQEDLALVLKDAHRLLAVLFDVSIHKKFYTVAIAAIELMQLLSQAMWFGESALLQLPFFDERDAKTARKNKIGDLESFKLATMDKKKIVFPDWDDKHWNAINKVCEQLPDMSLSDKVEVDDEEDSEIIYEQDIVMVTISIKRLAGQIELNPKTKKTQLVSENGIGVDLTTVDDEELPDDADDRLVNLDNFEDEDKIEEAMDLADEKERQLLNSLPVKESKSSSDGEGKLAHCPFYPFPKHEKWCLLMFHKDKRSHRLLRIQKVPAFENETEVQIPMRMEERGVFNYEVQARCDSYVGCDVSVSFKIHVKKMTEMEEKKRVKQIELGKEYGLDDEEEEEVEEEGVWYYLYFASFWEMVLNIVVLGAMAFMGYNFLKTRGFWDKYFQPVIDIVLSIIDPIWAPLSVVTEPVLALLQPVINVILLLWEKFTYIVIPPEELSPNFKPNQGEHSEL